MDSARLQRRLRAAFDARVFNHGDYNLVYAQPSGTSGPLVIGYRRSPLEMVLCPVDPTLQEPPPAEGGPLTTISLANVATVADTGSGYQVETVTGFRTWFEVVERMRVPVGEITEDGVVDLDQSDDAADFHGFMTAVMDELDRFYAAPEAPVDHPRVDGPPKAW